MNKNVSLQIGAMSDPIYRQLKKQKFNIPKEKVSHFQRAHDGFVQLRILGCMGDKEADRIAQRLCSKLARFVENYMNTTTT